MSTKLVTDEVWKRLHSASLAVKQRPSYVAVAYFSRDASRRLRLAPRSRLVVDASIGAVRSGQTHPHTLRRLVRRGVRVYNVANLHAKVYVLGRRAFIGSANASESAAHHLVEALLETTEHPAVNHAREFVRSLCMEKLTPRDLAGLQKQYREPRGGTRRDKHKRKTAQRVLRAKLAPLRVEQLVLEEWTDDEEAAAAKGKTAARKDREHTRGWELQSYRLVGHPRVRRGQLVMQVVEEDGRTTKVEPPGKVVGLRRYKSRRRRSTFAFAELPKVERRPRLERIARSIGPGALKRLRKSGNLSATFAQRVLRYWELRQAG